MRHRSVLGVFALLGIVCGSLSSCGDDKPLGECIVGAWAGVDAPCPCPPADSGLAPAECADPACVQNYVSVFFSDGRAFDTYTFRDDDTFSAVVVAKGTWSVIGTDLETSFPGLGGEPQAFRTPLECEGDTMKRGGSGARSRPSWEEALLEAAESGQWAERPY
jgi:hypothetical protein